MTVPRRHRLAVPELIAKKRDGGALTEAEIRALVSGFMDGSVTDYQMSAFAMAVYFRGMTFEETVAMTLAMRDSGKVVDLSHLNAPTVDKHSTGGVGDKVSICLAPMVAACGVAVPMMCGRGLGHTGGTLDKLEAIPGFQVDPSVRQFRAQLRKLGCAIIGQTESLAPADKRLYALRDVTGTVESVPLITSSILSKKLAEGIDALVLDVKAGRGAFMKTESDARELARSLVKVGRLAGMQVSALLTDMNSPIGYTIGNGIETAEALEVLHGDGPDDLLEITLALGSEMLRAAGLARTGADAARQLRETIRSGSAARKMKEIVAAQGGDARVVDEPDRMKLGRQRQTITARSKGFVGSIDPLELGHVSIALGAGRRRADDSVDPSAGIRLHVKVGDEVQAGEPLATLYSSKKALITSSAERAIDSFTMRKSRPKRVNRIIGAIRR